MKHAHLSFSMLALLLVTGCASKVVTYNQHGQMIGSCIAKPSIFNRTQAHCYGYSENQRVTFSKPTRVLSLTQQPTDVSSQLMKSDSPLLTVIQQQPTTLKVELEDLPTHQQIKIRNLTPTLK